MRYDPSRHHRRSTRLRGWDYTNAGWYHVTIVVKDRECVFGRVVNGVMEHSPLGLVADACWSQIPEHHAGVSLDEHIVMPNHVHGIVVIDEKRQEDGNVRGGVVRGRDVQLNVPTGNSNMGNVPTGITNPLNVPTGNSNMGNVPTGSTNDKFVPGGGENALNVPTEKSNETNAANIPTGYKSRRINPSMSPAKGSLSVIIRTFKAAVTTWAHANGYGGFAWVGRFHDHIIRNDQELKRIRDYIRNNPRNWSLDSEHSETDPSKSN